MERKAQVIVVGGGIWGLACAHACAGRGLRVRLLEAATIGAGASGGIVGALAPHVPDQWNPKKQFQFEALSTADSFWQAVEAEGGLASGYGRIGRVQPLGSLTARSLAAERITGAARHWGGSFGWMVEPAPAWLNPDLAPFGVIRDTLSARIFPARATAALAAACRVRGVDIREATRVRRLYPHGLETDDGPQEADAVILAAGVSGFDLLAPYANRVPGSGQKGQAALLSADLAGHPQLYADGLYVIPHDGGVTAVGSTSESAYDDPTGTDDQLEALIDRARVMVPALANAPVTQRWAGLRPKARRRDPMLGPVPGLPGHFAAMGAFKIGFGLAQKVGDNLAAMVAGEPPEIPDSFTFDWHMAK